MTDYTNWFDVKEYTSVVLTVKTENGSFFGSNRPFTLIWGKGDADHPPFDSNLTDSDTNHEKDILCEDQCPSMKANETRSFEFPVRTRWVLLKKQRDVANNFAEVSWPMFKKAPTALSIRDDTNVTEIASIVVDESPQINYISNGSQNHTITESEINLAVLGLTLGAKTFTVTSVAAGWSANFNNEIAYANDLDHPVMLAQGTTSVTVDTNDNIVLQIHKDSDPTQIYYYDIYTNSMNENDHSNTRYTISRFHPYTENAIKVALTDSSGLLISTTNHNDVPNALFVHMSNSGGDSVDTLGERGVSNRNLTQKVLATSVTDSSNIAIASTGLAPDSAGDHDKAPSGNALITAFTDSDTCLQAATEPIAYGGKAGAPGDKTVTKDVSGRAFYYALSDHFGTPFTSIDTCGYHEDKLGKNGKMIDMSYNAMYVHLTNKNGKSISNAEGNELPVIMSSQTASTSKKPFDSPIESSMTMVSNDLSNTSFKIHSLGIANELPITVWVKVYDVSTGKITLNSTDAFTSYKGDIVYNIPVMPGDYRDLHMSQGVEFENGLYMRINDSYEYDNSYYPIDKDKNAGKVYITGTYSTQN